MNDKHLAVKYSDSALVLCKQLVTEHPESSYAYSGCGMAYAGSGNMTDAIISGRTAVELANDDNMEKSDAIFNLAKIYIMAGDFANATRQADYLLSNPSAFSLNLMKADPDFKKLAESSDFKSITGKRTGI
jgi:Flp pilus assembly protein TadD